MVIQGDDPRIEVGATGGLYRRGQGSVFPTDFWGSGNRERVADGVADVDKLFGSRYQSLFRLSTLVCCPMHQQESKTRILIRSVKLCVYYL